MFLPGFSGEASLYKSRHHYATPIAVGLASRLSPGESCCDGKCVNLQTDPFNWPGITLASAMAGPIGVKEALGARPTLCDQVKVNVCRKRCAENLILDLEECAKDTDNDIKFSNLSTRSYSTSEVVLGAM
jgi:hypothetical protein